MKWREKFHTELALLNRKIKSMSDITIEQLRLGLEALESGNRILMEQVILADRRIDSYQNEIEDLATKLIAMEQPVAGELREIVSIIKIVSSIERIGDHAKHLAEGAQRVGSHGREEFVPHIRIMAEKGIEMLQTAVNAFVTQDVELAQKVAAMDEDIDALKKSLSVSIMDFMKRGPEYVEEGASLLFLNRFMERLGDHVTNLCEWVYFTRTGDHIELN